LLPISIGVSRCLVGDSVRYNGTDKYSIVCCSTLAENFELHSICPEVESGLSVPRAPVELVQYSKRLKAQGRDDLSVDVTDQLLTFFDHKVPTLASLSGFVLTPRSPSCGLNTVVIKSPDGDVLSRQANGLFVTSLMKHFPYLPLIEEPALVEESELSLFQLRVIVYYLIKKGILFSKEPIDKSVYGRLVGNFHGGESKKNQMMTLNKRLGLMTDEQITNLLTVLKENLNDEENVFN